jgi:hypothetical protein
VAEKPEAVSLEARAPEADEVLAAHQKELRWVIQRQRRMRAALDGRTPAPALLGFSEEEAASLLEALTTARAALHALLRRKST